VTLTVGLISMHRRLEGLEELDLNLGPNWKRVKVRRCIPSQAKGPCSAGFPVSVRWEYFSSGMGVGFEPSR
jgi:hypothetical protein